MLLRFGSLDQHVSLGQNEKLPFSGLCQLPPAADITTQMPTLLSAKTGRKRMQHRRAYSITSSARASSADGAYTQSPVKWHPIAGGLESRNSISNDAFLVTKDCLK